MFRRKFYFIVALVALMVVGFLATSLSSYYIATDTLSRQISEQTLPLTSDNVYSEIQRDLLRPILISSLMANDTFLRDWVLDGEIEPLRVQSFLSATQQRYNTITAYFISEASRNYYHASGIIKQVSEEDPLDQWYFRAGRRNEPYEINVDHDTVDRSRLNIFVNYRVMDYSGNFIGITGVGLSVESVSQLINSYQQRYGRSIYFIDRLGVVTLTGSASSLLPEERLQHRPGLGRLTPQILSSLGANLSYRNEAGEEVFLNSRLVPEFDWYLVVEQQGSGASERIQNTLWVNIGLSLGILALVLLASHFTLQAYQRRLEEMATTDRLTGLANRHVFEPIFSQVTRSAAREQKRVSIVSIDIDRFKTVNDTFGHPGGDLVLKTVADTIRAHVRESDTVCRWGGEEFILLLDDCAAKEAAGRAESIRRAVAELAIPFGREHIHVTLSLGVTEHRKGESLDLLINRVDAVLYEAKARGRDQVCLAE